MSLGEVLRHAAADHEQARGAGGDLHVGQLAEVRHRVDGDVGAAWRAIRSFWCFTRPNPAELSTKAGQKIGAPFFIGGLDQRAGFLGVAGGQPLADLIDEFAGGIGARLKAELVISRMV